MPKPNEWPEKDITTLKECWNKGMTASDIAITLQGIYSRSAILGKAHRLELSSRKKVKKPKAKKIARHDAIYKTTHTKPLPAPPPPPPKPVAKKLTRARIKLPKEFNNEQYFQNWIANLRPRLPEILRIPKNGHCKYIFGEVLDKANAYWCGKKTVSIESSWCPYHKKLVYQAPGTYRLTGKRRRKA